MEHPLLYETYGSTGLMWGMKNIITSRYKRGAALAASAIAMTGALAGLAVTPASAAGGCGLTKSVVNGPVYYMNCSTTSVDIVDVTVAVSIGGQYWTEHIIKCVPMMTNMYMTSVTGTNAGGSRVLQMYTVDWAGRSNCN